MGEEGREWENGERGGGERRGKEGKFEVFEP
jgi:hypothetical protein